MKMTNEMKEAIFTIALITGMIAFIAFMLWLDIRFTTEALKAGAFEAMAAGIPGSWKRLSAKQAKAMGKMNADIEAAKAEADAPSEAERIHADIAAADWHDIPVDPDLHGSIRRICQREGRPAHEVIADAIEDYAAKEGGGIFIPASMLDAEDANEAVDLLMAARLNRKEGAQT